MAGDAKSAGGRPSDYQPEFVDQAAKLCALGATDEEVGDFFGVSSRTIYRWKAAHPEFCQALKSGKEHADERVERSLYQKATGFYFVEQQAIKLKVGPHLEKVEIVEVERYAPADTTAGIFWLKNRRAEAWRDKHEVEHKVNVGVTGLTDGELEAIAAGRSAGIAAPPLRPEELN